MARFILKFDCWFDRVLFFVALIVLFGTYTSVGVVIAQEHKTSIEELTPRETVNMLDVEAQRITRLETAQDNEKEYHEKIRDLENKIEALTLQHQIVAQQLDWITRLLEWIGLAIGGVLVDLLHRLVRNVLLPKVKVNA